jgi:hypothetical protein
MLQISREKTRPGEVWGGCAVEERAGDRFMEA